jgi:IS1 family transposase
MWSYVGKKTNPRWLWHAIDRRTGQVLAYVFGRRKDEVFLQLKRLLEPLVSKDFVRMDGVPINGICQHRSMKWGNEKPKELSANTCD